MCPMIQSYISDDHDIASFAIVNHLMAVRSQVVGSADRLFKVALLKMLSLMFQFHTFEHVFYFNCMRLRLRVVYPRISYKH